MRNENLIAKAIRIVGLQPLAAACGVTYQAVRLWERNNRMPRTEWTGETQYAQIIERETRGFVTAAELLQEYAPRSVAHITAQAGQQG